MSNMDAVIENQLSVIVKKCIFSHSVYWRRREKVENKENYHAVCGVDCPDLSIANLFCVLFAGSTGQ